MLDVQQLIHEVDRHDDPQAIIDLGELGMSAFGTVVDAIRRSPRMTAGGLGAAILRIRDPAVVPALIPFLDDAKTGLAIVAFQVLGQSKQPMAFKPLLDYLTDPEKREIRRALAAKALGNYGDTRAIPALLAVVDEAVKEGLFYLAVDCVIALAKLGNHSRAYVAVDLVTDRRRAELRSQATEALQYTVAKGMMPTLGTALRDKDREVRVGSIDALFYLGTKSSIALLVESVKDKDPGVKSHALMRLRGLAGRDLDEVAGVRQARSWWASRQSEFEDGVCYRLGQPIRVSSVIELLSEPGSRKQVVKELWVITGNDFGFDPALPDGDPGVQGRARRWWNKSATNFHVW